VQAQLFRIDLRCRDLDPTLQKQLKRLPSEYFGTNIAITTSGVFSHRALTDAIQTIGIDDVMFSIDYPYESTEQAAEFIRSGGGCRAWCTGCRTWVLTVCNET
jgi:2,3-dihydroxybenzoate decarboxylase